MKKDLEKGVGRGVEVKKVSVTVYVNDIRVEGETAVIHAAYEGGGYRGSFTFTVPAAQLLKMNEEEFRAKLQVEASKHVKLQKLKSVKATVEVAE